METEVKEAIFLIQVDLKVTMPVPKSREEYLTNAQEFVDVLNSEIYSSLGWDTPASNLEIERITIGSLRDELDV